MIKIFTQNKKVVLTIVTTILINGLSAQAPSLVNDPIIQKITQPNQTFENIRNDANNFYIPLRASNGGDPVYEEKVFRRWEYYTQSRCMYPGAPAGGSVAGAEQYMSTLNNYYVCNTGFASSPWTSLGQNPTPSDKQDIGIIISVAVDPGNNSIIYAGSNTAGLWKTTNGGATWTNKTDLLGIASLGINAIAIDPNNSNNILAGTGTRSYGWAWINPGGVGVLKSTDGGNTWTTTNIASFPGDFLNIEVIKYHPTNTNIVYAAGNKKIWKSTDGGSSWTLMFTNPSAENVNFIDMEVDILNSNIIYASTNYSGLNATTAPNVAQLFVSTNAGATWLNKTPPQTILNDTIQYAISIDLTPVDASNVYVAYTNGASQQFIRKSSNNGNTWTLVNQFGTISGWGWWKNEFEVSNTNINIFYLGGNTMYKSTNSGASWFNISQYYPGLPAINSTHADIRALVQLPSMTGDFLIIGNDGGVAKTTNGGSLWTNINGSGLIITQFYAFGSYNSNNNLVGGTQDNGTKFKNGATNVWSSFVLSRDGGWTEVDYANDSRVYSSIYDNIYRSNTGGGGGYSTIANPGADGVLGRRFHLDPSNHNRLWWGAKNLYVYDAIANNWTLKYTTPGNNDISAINVAPSNGNVVYLAYWGPTWGNPRINKLLKTTNGGASWTDISINFPAYDWTYITDFEIDPYNPNRVWASCAGYWQGVPSSQGANRVVFSNDGGTTWTDVSTGLPPFPVNCLVYRNGTDDEIYAGTDAGVYRWNKPLQTWECFNNNLPPAIITKLEINNCKGKILASTFGRGIWEAPLPQASEYYVTSTQTWDALYNRSFNTNVVVNAGVTLTIKGTVNFAENTRLIIMPNARVILDGGKLTNGCGGMWEGVNVGGTGNQPQTPFSGGLSQYQGIIDLTNNATIENARNGISTSLVDINGNYIWTSFGGIIRATNAKFINNRRDVEFMSYPTYNNLSYFNNCLFEVNQLLVGGVLPYARISMWNVKNVNIRGCNFKYSAGNAYPSLSRGYGIRTIDAKYNVGDYCTSFFYPCPTGNTIQSKFENWDYGILSENSNVLMNANINHTIFINNGWGGAKLSGMHYPVFNNCEVEVGNEYQSYGLYLQNCKYYKIQNNTFTNTTGNTEDIGIYVFNSSYGAHEIYRNDFSNMTVGIGAMDDNSGVSNFTDGLKMNCNRFFNSSYEIAQLYYVTPPTVSFIQGLITPQENTLVRNFYTVPTCVNENRWYIDASAKSVIHGCHAGFNTIPNPTPSCSDGLVNVATTTAFGPWDYTRSCPNLLNKGISDIKLEKSALKTEVNLLKSNYATIIDGGNTQNLLNAINSNMSPGNLKNLLMNNSPYLSDVVLLAYINKTQTPPHGHIKEVVIANSPVTDPVKNAVDNLNLPNGIKQQINNAQTGISKRFELEGAIILKNFEIQSRVSEEISYYLNDTLDASSIDSVLYLIKTENRPHAACDLVKAYIYKGDYVSAGEILDTLELKPQLSDFCIFQRLIIELNTAAEKCYVMKDNLVKKQEVEAIANDEQKESSCHAQALLKQVFDYTYPEIKLLPIQQSNRMMQFNNEENIWTETDEQLFIFQLYPNPAYDNVTLLFKSVDSYLSAKIEIRDVTGKLIDVLNVKANTLQNYSTDKLTNSIYFATLYIDGKLIKQQKLVLVK
jgi:uncharacterized protein involved in tolerance to divalent cations/photosystem II stability/assembly factor-like uncharacterized protein